MTVPYMQGFKLLVDWLSPISIPKLDVKFKFRQSVYSYEQQEIARILNADPWIIQQELLKALVKLNGHSTETTQL